MTRGSARSRSPILYRVVLIVGALYAVVGLLLSPWVPLIPLTASATVWVWGAAELLGRNVIIFRVTVSALADVLPFAGATTVGLVMACWYGIIERRARRALNLWVVSVGSLFGLAVLLAWGLLVQLEVGAAVPVTIALTVLFGASLAGLSFVAVPKPAPSRATSVAMGLWRLAGVLIALFVTLPLGLLALVAALVLSGWLAVRTPSPAALDAT